MSDIKLKILTIALTVDLSLPFVWSAIQLMHVINGSLNSVAPAYAPGVFATHIRKDDVDCCIVKTMCANIAHLTKIVQYDKKQKTLDVVQSFPSRFVMFHSIT